MNTKTILVGAAVAIAATWLALSVRPSTVILAKTVLPALSPTPEKPLNQAAVDSWIVELKRTLPDFVSDEEDIDAIAERWKARKDLAGKTPSQLLSLLFHDVTAVIDDSKLLNKIWLNWEVRYKGIKEKASAPSGTTSQTDCSGSKTEKGTVKWFNDTKGYGYISRTDGTEVFVHYAAIIGPRSAQTLKEGDRVRFAVVSGQKNLNATCVAKIGK